MAERLADLAASFVVARNPEAGSTLGYLVKLATGDLYEYGWSPNGQTVIYTQLDTDAAAVDLSRPYAIRASSATDRSAT